MRTLLFGAEVETLRGVVRGQSSLDLVEENPDVVICYGGDGTLLSAEAHWPGVPKVPIRNSRRGNRCIPHPPEEVIRRLVEGRLVRNNFLKLEGKLVHGPAGEQVTRAVAMNEFNVHMANINSAVRFTLSLDGALYLDGREIIGDGFVVSTPFGSTAYFNQITRGVFHTGLGIAFKNTSEHTSHLIVPEETVVTIQITRGPAVMAHDNVQEYSLLEEGNELVVRRHPDGAVLLVWEPLHHPFDAF